MTQHIDARDMGTHPVDDVLDMYGVRGPMLAKLTDDLHAAGYTIAPLERGPRDNPRLGGLIEAIVQVMEQNDDIRSSAPNERPALAALIAHRLLWDGWRLS
jgi:hypothetical protein